MSKESLIKWLKEQQPNLENILLAAGEEYYNNYSSKRTFNFDAKKTGEELWLLGGGEDLCYDRPTIGFNYSLWYHPKRINTFLRYFTDLIYDSRNDSNIEIFDLGAGTGAVLWAVGLIVQGLKTLNLPCPKIRVVNIDTSPFMIMYNYHYLWKNFVLEYPAAADISKENDYRLNSWSNLDESNCSNIWLCASYLFDHSENREAIANDFKLIVEQYKPNRILLLSSLNKKVYCDAAANKIQELNFSSSKQILDRQIFSGSLAKLSQFRSRISQQRNLGLTGVTKWDIDSLYGRILINNNQQLGLEFSNLNLFIQPERNRAKIKMTQQQQDAANITTRPTLVIGPAGCGKTVVLTQKIKNIIENSKIQNDYDVNLKILVTTFNKGLVKYLGDWIEQLLEQGKFTRSFTTNFNGILSDFSYFRFNNSQQYNIYVLHFDVLPTKIGNIAWHNVTTNGGDIEDFHLNRMKQSIEKYVAASKIDTKKFAKILDAEFLLDEYHRIVYGNLCNTYSSNEKTENNYAFIARDGRGNNPQLRYNSERRKIVWSIINIYLRDLKNQNLESFIIRRHRLLKRLQRNVFQNKFTHIIVDEFQDCTKADYEIFYQMLQNSNDLTLAGDIAQSINLGASLHIPKADDQRNFLKKKLMGSFRLPFRVSECIRPLSELINKKFGEREGIEADIINPYKGAPPGSRPIIVFASDANSAADKITEIFAAYKNALKLDKVTIFERDVELLNALSQQQTPAETEIILRTKGLEKNCVIWSTRINVDTQNEKEEFIYTILTRTVSLLIIVIFPAIQQDYLNIIKKFVAKRLILWDDESEIKYQEIMQFVQTADNQEDQDNSDDNNTLEDEKMESIVE